MSDSSESIVLETTRRILADLADPQTVNAASDDSWKAPLWQTLEESGLTLAWVSDSLGGAGASVADGFDVLRVAGQYAAPVALSETLIAGWLLSAAGQECPAGAMTVAPIRDGDNAIAQPQAKERLCHARNQRDDTLRRPRRRVGHYASKTTSRTPSFSFAAAIDRPATESGSAMRRRASRTRTRSWSP